MKTQTNYPKLFHSEVKYLDSAYCTGSENLSDALFDAVKHATYYWYLYPDAEIIITISSYCKTCNGNGRVVRKNVKKDRRFLQDKHFKTCPDCKTWLAYSEEVCRFRFQIHENVMDQMNRTDSLAHTWTA